MVLNSFVWNASIYSILLVMILCKLTLHGVHVLVDLMMYVACIFNLFCQLSISTNVSESMVGDVNRCLHLTTTSLIPTFLPGLRTVHDGVKMCG